MVDLAGRGPNGGDSLLAAKVSVPSTRAVTVPRALLVEQLRQAWDTPLVAVTAPPGYGKTTLQAEWAALEERPVGWVTVDRHDDDPVVLVTALATALAQMDPDADGRFDDWVASEPAGLSVGRRMAAALAAVDTPIVIVIDDVHHLSDAEALDVIDLVVGSLPEGSQVAIASRVDPPFLARCRTRGETFEIGPEDLRLDADAAFDVFRAVGAPVTPELAEEVVALTEGWPAGIYLSALVARRIPEAWQSPLPISGEDRFIADYLSREALQTLPPEIEQFLLSSSVLEVMSAPLCEAALEMTGAAETLRELERWNLFLVPLDRQRQWFRYHSLFRDLLLAELRRRDPAAIPRIRRRAAQWHVADGTPDRAIDYLLSDGEADEVGPLIAAQLVHAYHEGRLSTLRRWLDRCRPEVIENHPPLAVLAAWIAALSGDATNAERWAAIVAHLSFTGPLPDGSASFESSSAILRALLCASGPAVMAADADLAVGSEPPWSPWRDTALWLRGEAHRLADEPEDAVRCFTEAIELSSPARLGGRPPMLMAFVERGLIAVDAGNWSSAAADARAAVAQTSVKGASDYLAAGMAHALAALVARHDARRADLAIHLELATRARQMATYATPVAAVELRVILADLHATDGDERLAMEILDEADGIVLRRPRLGALLDRRDRIRERLERRKESGSHLLTPAELRVLPYLRTHLTFAEIGERLYVSRNTVNTQAGSIYRKLGVSSRAGAVDRALDLGLLPA